MEASVHQTVLPATGLGPVFTRIAKSTFTPKPKNLDVPTTEEKQRFIVHDRAKLWRDRIATLATGDLILFGRDVPQKRCWPFARDPFPFSVGVVMCPVFPQIRIDETPREPEIMLWEYYSTQNTSSDLLVDHVSEHLVKTGPRVVLLEDRLVEYTGRTPLLRACRVTAQQRMLMDRTCWHCADSMKFGRWKNPAHATMRFCENLGLSDARLNTYAPEMSDFLFKNDRRIAWKDGVVSFSEEKPLLDLNQ